MLGRAALILLLPLAAPALHAAAYGPDAPSRPRTTPAEDAIALYQTTFAHQTFKPCPPARPGEITVCGRGRGGSPERLPLPDERGPRDSPRQPTGEVPRAAVGLAAASDKCDGIGCGPKIGVNLLKAPRVLVQAIHGLIDPEWASDQGE
jgi:hypothetical protein